MGWRGEEGKGDKVQDGEKGDEYKRNVFFRKKKEYEISACLVGSERCIRDMYVCVCICVCVSVCVFVCVSECVCMCVYVGCLLYSSDADDEEDCVDHGGCRNFKPIAYTQMSLPCNI